MLRLLATFFLLGIACLGSAEPSEKYLVDFILFENKSLLEDAAEQSLIPPILLSSSTSIPLALGDYAAQPDYRNLSISQSELRNTYAALNRSEDYQVLARYTWQQPTDGNKPIDLPPITRDNWHIKGRISLKPGRFPFLNTNLLISNDHQTIALRHNQALMVKQTYYLDHPIFGMIIRVTPVKPPESETT